MRPAMIRRTLEILLVEDSMLDARVVIEVLRGSPLKHRLTLIRDGVEALEFLNCEGKFTHAPRPDVILLDLYLPKKDGWQVLSDMREDYGLHDIPVIIVTGSAIEEYTLASEGLDVEHFLTKPVDPDELLSAIAMVARSTDQRTPLLHSC